ncbi:R1A1-element\ORF2 [Symbiodinium sp. CCMP2592]|nr:R1A1-element\ORF2 [Symbiodinium sp. CCMP2592]
MAAVPVPSDDEDLARSGSPEKSRKREAVESESAGGQMVTLADLQRLLEAQSVNLAKLQATEIRGAMQELKQATATEIRGIKTEVAKNTDHIAQLRDQGDKLEARIQALENGRSEGSTMYPGSSSESHQKNLLILGGWSPDTHRDDLLPELREMMEQIGVLAEFQDVFTTGPRRGHAMGIVKWPAGQSEQDLKRRLIKIVQEIRGASMASKSMPAGKNLWAAISKTKMVNESEKHAMDVEWTAGSLWLRSMMVASATRAAPKNVEVAMGKMAGTWIDINQIARLLGTSSAELEFEYNECQGPLGVKAEEGEVYFFSWNIGGKVVETALELPRIHPGWKTTYIEDRTLVQYRGEDQWRGNGICFPSGRYVCLRRKASDLGVWLRLRDVTLGTELWVWSARLSTGVTDDVTADEMQQVLQLRPPSVLASVVLADYNAQIRWTNAAGAQGQALPTSGRLDFLLGELDRQGYSLRAPGVEQWDTPTSRPRRRNARGRQIDGVATKNSRKPEVHIDEGSGDHERIEVRLPVSLGKSPGPEWDTRPRVVTGEIPPQPGLNQTRMEQLAEQYTQPRKGNRYRDPPDVRQAFRRARKEDTETAWKAAQVLRRRARDSWHEAKVTRAGQAGWQDLRELRDRSGTEWAVYMTEEAYRLKKDPLNWTTKHFADLFKETAATAAVTWNREATDGVPFSAEELRSVVAKGKTKKAVGLDLTSYELVKALCKDETSEGSLLSWMESIRMGAEIPAAWMTTIITLLPKKNRPESPADLRPISLSSALGKIFGGLILQRTRAVLVPKGPEQCALGGRQTADYLFSVFKSFAVETEWRFGLGWIKIDIHKAYDSIHRGKILEYLAKELPGNMYREYQAWARLLGPGSAHVRTPWGCQRISQTRGIRQGAVESPLIFAIAMECALHKAQAKENWPREISSAPDMLLSSLLFMDDSILWDSRRSCLELKYRLFKDSLQEWGLSVNPRKTVFYASPHSPEGSVIHLDDVEIRSSPTLEVMGVHFSVPLKPAAIMDTGMAKARRKFHASRDVLECRGPLKKRLTVFQATVGGAALWYSAAATPTPQGMGALNTMQLEMVGRMAGLRRRTEESWLDFRKRGLRAARQILYNAGMERWSTMWLRRHWQYRGHVARAAQRTSPPASAIMDEFRTLRWWRGQQCWRDGVRHPAAFYPHLSNEEIRLNRAARCGDWRQMARDPPAWKQAEARWIQQNDIAWCSGRQLALRM